MLVWNVYFGDFNRRVIRTYNVFDHFGFWNDLVKAKKKHKDDREAFAEDVRISLRYFFWAKCEWEIILDHWPSKEGFEDKKVDVFDQINLNWERFIDYIWENRSKIKKRGKRT